MEEDTLDNLSIIMIYPLPHSHSVCFWTCINNILPFKLKTQGATNSGGKVTKEIK